MYRVVIKELQQWKRKNNRKPLIIQGARQVGKTWILQEFGKSDFQNVAYINFESSTRLRNIFEADFDTARIIESIAIECDQIIKPSKTLIILDGIQATDKCITSLKYFCENAPEYHIVAAGSLLGVAINQHTSFPVGKVDFLNIYPLSFSEFLWNLNEKK
jgi:uncharacterized protein